MKMYFIAHVLPEDIDRKVLAEKKWMQERYGCRVGLKSPAHITFLPPFWMDESLEPALIADLDRMPLPPPFPLATDHFSAFRPRTIFVAIAASEALQALKKDVDAYFKARSSFPLKFDTRPFHPHITIATRDLHKKDFAEAWPHFADREFREAWRVDSLSLLRHDGHSWQVIHSVRFPSAG